MIVQINVTSQFISRTPSEQGAKSKIIGGAPNRILVKIVIV